MAPGNQDGTLPGMASPEIQRKIGQLRHDVDDVYEHALSGSIGDRLRDLEHLSWWARCKGIMLVGTDDFTHPAWFDHLRENLVPAQPAKIWTATSPAGCHRTWPQPTSRFMLSVRPEHMGF